VKRLLHRRHCGAASIVTSPPDSSRARYKPAIAKGEPFAMPIFDLRAYRFDRLVRE
jgi:hypothetical protein